MHCPARRYLPKTTKAAQLGEMIDYIRNATAKAGIQRGWRLLELDETGWLDEELTTDELTEELTTDELDEETWLLEEDTTLEDEETTLEDELLELEEEELAPPLLEEEEDESTGGSSVPPHADSATADTSTPASFMVRINSDSDCFVNIICYLVGIRMTA